MANLTDKEKAKMSWVERFKSFVYSRCYESHIVEEVVELCNTEALKNVGVPKEQSKIIKRMLKIRDGIWQ